MKESDKKESPSPNPSKNSFDIIREALKKLEKEGVPLKEEPMGDEFIVMLNPPKSLVEKMQKAKQEEAAKKKK